MHKLETEKRFVLVKYVVHRNDRIGRGEGGGTAILVKNRFKHHQLLTAADLQQMENTI